jgi:hypothetical protein
LELTSAFVIPEIAGTLYATAQGGPIAGVAASAGLSAVLETARLALGHHELLWN